MKKIIAVLIILTLFSLFIPPQPAEARGYGWFLPGLIIGGAIGWGLAAPRYYPPPYYYYPPRPYYYYPPPAYYYPPPVYSYPPPEAKTLPEEPASKPPSGGRLFIYPRQGQSPEKLEADRNECHAWALGQTGYDPTKPPPEDLDAARAGQMSLDYERALGACLDGRGYTVR
ncbi:MAG: hypothetical protein HY892_04550 [Deltaproteobacteria bacterium]|nr:hypothetical protein [Deltaproteobacteria bacterium]